MHEREPFLMVISFVLSNKLNFLCLTYELVSQITQGKQCVLALKNETPNNLKVFTTMVTGDQLEHFINYCSSSPSLPVLEANEDCFNAWRNSITQFGSIGMLPLMLPGWYSDTVVNTVMYNAEVRLTFYI